MVNKATFVGFRGGGRTTRILRSMTTSTGFASERTLNSRSFCGDLTLCFLHVPYDTKLLFPDNKPRMIQACASEGLAPPGF